MCRHAGIDIEFTLALVIIAALCLLVVAAIVGTLVQEDTQIMKTTRCTRCGATIPSPANYCCECLSSDPLDARHRDEKGLAVILLVFALIAALIMGAGWLLVMFPEIIPVFLPH